MTGWEDSAVLPTNYWLLYILALLGYLSCPVTPVLIYLFLHVLGGISECICESQRTVFSYHLGSKDQSHVIIHGDMCLYSLTHLSILPTKEKKVSCKTSLSLKPVSTCKCSCAFVPVEFWDWRSRTFLLQEWRRPGCGIPDQQGISSRSSPSTPCPLQKLCYRIKLRSEGRALFPTTRRVCVHPCCACWGACTDCSSS